MPDLTTLLTQALANMEDLLDRQTILIDQMQDFFTSTDPTVPFLKPDNTTVFIQSWLETVSQMEQFQATALGDMAPLCGGAAQTAEFSLFRPVIYVDANNGDDLWDGSQPFPNTGSAGPFATLAKAISVARTGHRLQVIELKSGTAGTPQIYPVADFITAANAHLILRGSSVVVADIDETIVDFTGLDTGTSDIGSLNAESGKLNLSWLSFKSPHRLDSGNKYAAPIISILFGAHLEAFRCKFYPGDDVDTHSIGANLYSRALIYNFGGSLYFGLCTIDGDAPAGPTNVNGIFTRQSTSVHIQATTITNCAVGVGDQEGSRPGGFFTRQGGTFSANLTDYDFNSLFAQVANTNF